MGQVKFVEDSLYKIWYISTYGIVLLENISFSTQALLFLLMSAFLAKNQHFFGKNGAFTQSNSMTAV